MARTAPGVRLLPNAITVLALCAGLSAVQFALANNYELAIAAIVVAAVLDGLDGRIARLLDATSKMGEELDSLSDAVSFGVAPALVLYVWILHDYRVGWIVALIFAVCMVLRLARFNTLLDDTEKPVFTKEFFVGVPAPAGGLLALLPLMLSMQIGDGWWSGQIAVHVWTIGIAMLLISRVPTLSVKTAKVPAKAVAPLLVGVGLLAAAIIQFPMTALTIVALLYVAHIPYAVRRYRWLANHPEVWDVPPKERRAIRRKRSANRLGLRSPLRGRVAGAARRAVRRPRGREQAHMPETTVRPGAQQPVTREHKRRSWRRTGLRRNNNP
ncbi:CDP-diacylglycerol--serine O-phosphatidyltransferase [Tamaricihabitans halophyticus]|uniref:CDP-diacylglycerol--serine O-phosphatidyltransferase n=1 Tax=Tamaricihabitans halophyticus TaxID=1262583 RepID=A0A4R2R1P1_9PSEU|nr:CDP-diacylglycerol--serine O-phosphatidyltransferase [Tamaricihabitans halophyticus]TCP56602.1 CDP-diacylglycerol--serine O-phosphatidyltransferase [Tamaricihabitans halophyticus]